MKYWFKEALDRVDAADDDLNTPAEESHLLKVASKEYWVLGIQLGLSNEQMNQLYADPGNTHGFVFKYMVMWKKREGDKATVQRLNRAINAARLNFSNDDISEQLNKFK